MSFRKKKERECRDKKISQINLEGQISLYIKQHSIYWTEWKPTLPNPTKMKFIGNNNVLTQAEVLFYSCAQNCIWDMGDFNKYFLHRWLDGQMMERWMMNKQMDGSFKKKILHALILLLGKKLMWNFPCQLTKE